MIDMLFAAGLALAQPPAAPAAAEAPKAATAAETYAALVATAARVPTPLPYDDSRDHARRMASSDQNQSRFFNRPGATRADYDRQWTACRQIGRRLATYRGDGTVMASAFTHGGIVGGMLIGGFDAAFSQRRARQDIRRQCLIAAGYRLVLPDEAGSQRISAMSRAERTAWFDSALGAGELPVAGRVIDWDALVAAGGIRDAMDDDEDD